MCVFFYQARSLVSGAECQRFSSAHTNRSYCTMKFGCIEVQIVPRRNYLTPARIFSKQLRSGFHDAGWARSLKFGPDTDTFGIRDSSLAHTIYCHFSRRQTPRMRWPQWIYPLFLFLWSLEVVRGDCRGNFVFCSRRNGVVLPRAHCGGPHQWAS